MIAQAPGGWVGRVGLERPTVVPLVVASCYSLAIEICLQACGTALGCFVAQCLLLKFVAIATSSAAGQAVESSFLDPVQLEHLDRPVLLASPALFVQLPLALAQV